MIYLAADHAGFDLKEKVKEHLKENGLEFQDLGAFSLDKNDDYPDFIRKAAEAVSKDPENSRGIIFGGSGQAEAMVANKFPGVRCALFYAPVAPYAAADVTGRKSEDLFEMIRLTREHNDANILSIGARFVTEKNALQAVKFWLESPFSNAQRHVRRLKKVGDIENERTHF